MVTSSVSVTQCSETTLTSEPFAEVDADLAVVTVGLDAAGELVLDPAALALEGLLDQLQSTGFSGAWSAQRYVVAGGRAVLVVGTGAPLVAGLAVTLREPRHAVAAALAGITTGSVVVSCGGSWDPLLVEAAVLGTYRFDRYTTKKRPSHLIVSDVEPTSDEVAELTSRVQSVCFARDWVSAGPGDKRPAASADLLLAEAASAGVEVRLWSTEELIQAGCGGIVAVGQGSAPGQTACIVQLTARGTSDEPPLVLVGKGLTYDAGGVNLKNVWLEHMKLDMGGAAAVAGAVLHAGRRPRGRTVEGWIALAENLISATAYLAGDVISMHNDLSVEVANTDAEGRLALADAMSLADASGAAAVVTVATLTGAAIRALGPRTAAMMTTDDGFAEAFTGAAVTAGESLWRMPTLPYFADTLRSQYADTTNLGSMDGQTMVASAFLRRFAPEGVPYAHFDLAGPAFNMGEPYDGVPSGGTGYGVRTLIELVERV